MIHFECSQCRMKFRVKPEFAGRKSTCPTCKQPIVVPEPDQTVGYVPAGQIDGTVSSVHQAGVDGGVTLGSVGGPSTSESVDELLAKGKPSGQRYIIESEIARGGMGAVLRPSTATFAARSPSSSLLDDKDPKKKARFVEEAQITGQLEHPNIVPIHELGVDSKKRLFFAMKMVKGRSLKDVIDHLRDNPKQAEKEYSLARMLNILVGVCGRLELDRAYSHSGQDHQRHGGAAQNEQPDEDQREAVRRILEEVQCRGVQQGASDDLRGPRCPVRRPRRRPIPWSLAMPPGLSCCFPQVHLTEVWSGRAGPGRQDLAIGREGHAMDRRCRALERVQLLSRGQGPQLDGRIVTSRRRRFGRCCP